MRAVVELDHVRFAVACELCRSLCDDDLRPELLRLRVRAGRELLSGNSGRKAEIILDLRARSRLARLGSSPRPSRRQALRTRRRRLRPARGPGADDGDITNVRLVDGVVESETASNLAVGGIAQDDRPAANQHRHIVHAHMEPVEQFLNAGVAIEVDVGVGMPVSRQEFLDTQRAGRMHRSDEHDVADAVGNQVDSAEDERPDENVAELRVGLHERQQLVAADFDDFSLFDGTKSDKPSPT